MRVDFIVVNWVYCTWFQHHATTDMKICPHRHRMRVKRTWVQTSRNRVHRTWFSFASAIELLLLPFLFLLSPNAVPLSTSKPQKPMKKSNPKQIKPTLHSNVFFSSTRVAAKNHTLLRAILEAQVGRRSPTTRIERSWQTDWKPIKPKW